MKALLVKEDGLIYAAEVPEEPKYTGDPDLDMNNGRRYAYGVEAAKENALVCADQEKATGLIVLNHTDCMIYRGSLAVGVKPGIYPIPDLQFEVVDFIPTNITPLGLENTLKQVAILKESTPSTEQESQEELWLELMGILLAQYLSKGSMDYRETMKQFTITRKP